MTDRYRRRLLTAAGTGLTALLAGCQGGDSTDDASTETTGTTATVATTGTGTVTTTDTGPTESTPDEAAESTTDATTTESLGPGELESRATAFVSLLADGSYEAAHDRFTPAAGEAITASQLERVWTGLEDDNGEFLSLSGVETGTQSGYDVVAGVAEFERGRAAVTLSFAGEAVAGFRVRPVSGDWSPPAYADQSSFTEREVSLTATDGCSLGGTLTIPEGVDRTPGVVLVHGQGPMDRDGTVGPNKLYRDLAWGLATRGVAVLRYDKRTAACDVDLADVTIDEAVTDDALAAADALREAAVVADGDVVVAGHSIGGTLAPRIAKRDGDLAGVVMLAPLARSAADALLDQNRYLVNRDGTVTDAEEARLDRVRRIAEQIRSLDIADDETVYVGGDEYWRGLRQYDHLEAARRVETPRLLLFGGRDYQVTVEDDLPLWRNALDDGEEVTFERYPSLNHFFMPGTGKPGRAEYYEENHVAEQVVADVAAFAFDATGVEPGGGE